LKGIRRINELTHGHPSVHSTDNGYHIYQPVTGFILEEEERFAIFWLIPPAKIWHLDSCNSQKTI